MALGKPNLAHHSCFNIGDEVEVTSADHSLRGTLFPAKIIARLCKTNKFVVEYKSLEATDVPLRESVDTVLLRPLPPPENDHTFHFGDEVDAFFSGGWWEGIITQVDEGPAYWVYFRFAKQEFHFQPSEMRPHREWINGTWLPPREVSLKTEANSSKARMNKFSKGTAVEVSSDEDGFQGAWFAATVINARGQDKYLVKYKSLRTEDDMDYLREEVDIQHIRPRPPNAVMIDSYDLNEEVEAFCNDGWWEGVISKVVKGSRYKVYFKGTKDEVEFQHSDLRPRQDWIEGTWVRASQALKF
ncbi:protein AGENET DOMAIN (AGD)-CONTAINING P1-like [Alnus glutinosa]|uniref:protein AGENET DOMAIN (AGD)-CONTAINING P1-like n=1 Tax=Alnus glutinosa TaxID=3517 RepID=UPI002D766C4F|nr:protein AGENET DOMAIN (AGD)-CONTAINING P1-like [Alnus glutinosa]